MTTPITTRTAHLLHHLTAPIAARAQDLQETERELASLDGTTCTGRVTWRDKDKPSPKMVVTHAMDESCPIHGQAPTNGRLRVYVGTKPDAQAEAKAAIEREEQRKKLERRATDLRRVLDQAVADLKAIYGHLGYTAPDNDQQPEPNPNWTPDRARYRYY